MQKKLAEKYFSKVHNVGGATKQPNLKAMPVRETTRTKEFAFAGNRRKIFAGASKDKLLANKTISQKVSGKVTSVDGKKSISKPTIPKPFNLTK
jgi:hypothetical protein